jgi:hypothetical protein
VLREYLTVTRSSPGSYGRGKNPLGVVMTADKYPIWGKRSYQDDIAAKRRHLDASAAGPLRGEGVAGPHALCRPGLVSRFWVAGGERMGQGGPTPGNGTEPGPDGLRPR